MPLSSDDAEKNSFDLVRNIFFEEDQARLADIRKNKTRFVHYTTAESAIKIIQSKEMWLRKSSTMNDYMEVDHGVFLLSKAYEKFIGSELSRLFNPIFPGFCDELTKIYDSWLPTFKNETYLACMSIHEDIEDDIGRLSMWRAYGGQNGVALVLNNTPFVCESDALRVYSSKVNYSNGVEFDSEFRRLIAKLDEIRAVLPAVEKESIINLIFYKFFSLVVCTKHLGFEEEREWRILHHPKMMPSERVNRSIETIRGVPQQVIKVPFKSYPDEGLHGLEIGGLINRVIIGPTQYPLAIRDAFVDLLAKAGADCPEDKVFMSEIPLRV